MSEYASREQYLEALSARSALPRGFKAATQALSFFPVEKKLTRPLPMNLALILADEPTPLVAGCFTRNAFPGWPVVIGRERLTGERIGGVLVNNKISNVNTAGGREHAERLLARLAEVTGRASETFIPSSTGIIGWQLPVADMEAALAGLVAGLQGDSLLPVAEAIMTTDTFPKIRAARVRGAGAEGRIVATAKGAGMIEPNMATMLVYLLTDVAVPRERLRVLLPEVVGRTLNRISVDGDQSTSDTVLLMSSGWVGGVAEGAFREALEQVCAALAQDIVRNGEGTNHVLRVTVRGELPESVALGAARAVANSPLVKTAVFGNDPNVGRVLMALGDYFGNEGVAVARERLSFSIGGVPVYSAGAFALSPESEERVSRIMREAQMTSGPEGYPAHERTVDIDVTVGSGASSATVFGSDLSYDYVKENADYRS